MCVFFLGARTTERVGVLSVCGCCGVRRRRVLRRRATRGGAVMSQATPSEAAEKAVPGGSVEVRRLSWNEICRRSL